MKTLKRKLVSEAHGWKTWDLLVDNTVVGEYEERHDFVKAKETDRIRTKWALLSTITWKAEGLAAVYGQIDGGMRNIYGSRGRYTVREIAAMLPQTEA